MSHYLSEVTDPQKVVHGPALVHSPPFPGHVHVLVLRR